MNPRQRVQTALNHQETDRIPIDLGGTIVSSISKTAYLDLKRYLGMPLEEITMLDNVQQLPYVAEDLLQRFEVDFHSVQLPAATTPEGGFVFATVHNIQAFVPPENIVAAFDTALEYGKY